MDDLRLSLGKCCTKCGEWTLLEDFSYDRRKRDGRQARCRACVKEYARLWREKYPERSREGARRWYHDNIDVEKKREYNRRWRAKNREKRRKNARLEYQKKRLNPEFKKKGQEKAKRWRKENPEKARAQWRAKWARMANAEGSFSNQEWLDLCEAYGHRCLCCEQQNSLTVDHVVPLSKGGSNYIDNIQPLCLHCNLSKSAKTIDYR